MAEINFISLLKGGPLTILIALIKLGGQATTSALMAMTGYSKPTVISNARKLIHAGLATNNIMGWTLFDATTDLIFGQGKDSLPDVVGLSPLSNSSSILNSTSEGKVSLLQEAGVSDPVRTWLVEDDWYTLEYLTRHIKAWKKERNSGIGILVNRFKAKDPAPADPDDYVNGQFKDFINH